MFLVERQDIVEIFVDNIPLCHTVQDKSLKCLPDFFRLTNKLQKGKGSLQVCLSIYLSMYPSLNSLIHSSVHLFIYVSISQFINPFICPSVYLFIYVSISQSINPFICPSVHLSCRIVFVYIKLYRLCLILLKNYLVTKATTNQSWKSFL